jgi:hypothetical protein
MAVSLPDGRVPQALEIEQPVCGEADCDADNAGTKFVVSTRNPTRALMRCTFQTAQSFALVTLRTRRDRHLLRVSAAWAGRRLRLRPTHANTQPAFGCYFVNTAAAAEPAGLVVLTLAGDRISRITRFLDDNVLRRFRLDAPLW